jgi:V8-like Glu-specific endopeptidase
VYTLDDVDDVQSSWCCGAVIIAAVTIAIAAVCYSSNSTGVHERLVLLPCIIQVKLLAYIGTLRVSICEVM